MGGSLGSLLGGSWAALGAFRGRLGAHFGLQGHIVELLGPLFEAPLENQENFKQHGISMFFVSFMFPGSQRRSTIVPTLLRRAPWAPGQSQESAKHVLGGSGNALDSFRDASTFRTPVRFTGYFHLRTRGKKVVRRRWLATSFLSHRPAVRLRRH